MATYDPTKPPLSLEEKLAASPVEYAPQATTHLLVERGSEIMRLPLFDLQEAVLRTPAGNPAAGVTLTFWGLDNGANLPGAALQALIDSYLAAGVPEHAIGWWSIGTEGASVGGAFTVPGCTIRPVVAAPALAGVSAGLFTVPGVISQAVISAPALLGLSGGNFSIPGVNLQAQVAAAALVGAQAGVFQLPVVSLQPQVVAAGLAAVQVTNGAFTLPAISLAPLVVAAALIGVRQGVFALPAVSITPVVVAPELMGVEASSGIALTTANFDFRKSVGSTITENSPSAGDLTMIMGGTAADYALAVYKTAIPRATAQSLSIDFIVNGLTGSVQGPEGEEYWVPSNAIHLFSLALRANQTDVVGAASSSDAMTLFASMSEEGVTTVQLYRRPADGSAMTFSNSVIINQGTKYTVEYTGNTSSALIKIGLAGGALSVLASNAWTSIYNSGSMWLYLGDLRTNSGAGGSAVFSNFR